VGFALAVALVVLLGGGGVGRARQTPVAGHESRNRRAGDPGAQPTAPGSTLPRTGSTSPAGKLSLPEANDDGDAASITPAALKAPLADSCPGRRPDVLGAGGGGDDEETPTIPAPSCRASATSQAGSGRTHPVRLAPRFLQLAQRRRRHHPGPDPRRRRDQLRPPTSLLRVQDDKLRVVVKQVRQRARSSSNYPLPGQTSGTGRPPPRLTRSPISATASMTFLRPRTTARTRQTTAPVPAKFVGKTVRFPGRRTTQQAGRLRRSPQDGGRVPVPPTRPAVHEQLTSSWPSETVSQPGAHAHPQCAHDGRRAATPAAAGSSHPPDVGSGEGADPCWREYLTEVANRYHRLHDGRGRQARGDRVRPGGTGRATEPGRAHRAVS